MKFKEDFLIERIKIGDRFRVDYGDSGEFQEFVESIKDKGVIQPVTIDDKYNLLAGGRRIRACQVAGITTIPVVIRPAVSAVDSREIELFENIHRKAMTWTEEARAYKQIQDMFKEKYPNEEWRWSQRTLAKDTGKSQPLINRKIKAAEMLDIIPELAECKTEEEAIKRYKKIQNDLVIGTLRKQQEDDIASGKELTLKYAKSHFRIGDAFEEMQAIVDMHKKNNSRPVTAFAEVDPPYSIKLQEAKIRADDNANDDLGRYNEVSEEDYPEFLRRAASLVYSCLAEDAWCIWWFGPSWFTDVKITLTAAGFFLDPIPGIWNKGSGQTRAPEYYLARTYEPFFICRKGTTSIKSRGRSNVFTYPPVPAANKYHPTERPINLMMELLSTFVYPSQHIMVPFLGSGVTLRAAYQLDMNGFGWDLDEVNRDSFLIKVKEDEWKKQQEQEENE